MNSFLARHCKVVVMSLAAGAVSTLFAADNAPADKPVPEVKPLINRQNQVGSSVMKSIGEIRDLMDDAAQNPDVELPGKQQLNDAPPVLEDISRNHVPKVIHGIWRARDDAQAGLREGDVEMDAIIVDFDRLLTVMHSSLAPVEMARIIDTAIEKQKQAIEKGKEALEKHPGLEGKPRENLTPPEKSTLQGVLEKQREATTALQKVLQQLNPDDPSHSTARTELEKSGVEGKSKETHNDIPANKLPTAMRKGDEIIGALEHAKRSMNPNGEKTDLETKLTGLKELKEKQTGLMEETSKLNPKDGEGSAETAEGQGKISRELGKMGKDDPELHGATEQSRGAADDIASGKPGDASKKQRNVIDTLNRAIKNTENQIAAGKAESKNSPQSTAQNKPQPNKKGVEQQTQIAANALGSFEYQSAGAHGEGWSVALQPKDRADVEQAVAEQMPTKYANQIKLYYMSLQDSRAGN
jgi:hypothetical protein